MKAIWWMGLLATAAGAAACSSNGKLALTVSTKATAAAAMASTGGADLGNGIVLNEVRVVVRRLTLAQAAVPPDGGLPEGMGSTGDGGTGDDLENEIENEGPGIGPFFVDVQGDALKQGIHPSFDGMVPKGTYGGALISIDTVSQAQAQGNAGLQAMQVLHASIAVDGTFNGTAFEFTTPIEVTQTKAGPITVGDKTTNLTLDVDPSHWFSDSSGAALDPSDPSNLGAILENIRCSIRLIVDDDEDGLPDDGDSGEHCAVLAGGTAAR